MHIVPRAFVNLRNPVTNQVERVQLPEPCDVCHDVGVRPLGERWAVCNCPVGQAWEGMAIERGEDPVPPEGSEQHESNCTLWLAAECRVTESEAARWIEAGARPRSGVVAPVAYL